MYFGTARDEVGMQFVWDQKKARSNEAKHGVSFELAGLPSLTRSLSACPMTAKQKRDGAPWDA
jgi:uncharacterized DUF497 family protein